MPVPIPENGGVAALLTFADAGVVTTVVDEFLLVTSVRAVINSKVLLII